MTFYHHFLKQNKMGVIKKIVFITGATSGIGRSTAKIFAKNGYNLIITGRRADRLEMIKEKYESKYAVEIKTLCFDVRDQAAAASAIDSLDDSWDKIDILVNNAGLAKGLAPVHEGNLGHWEQMIDTNIKGLLYVTRLISPGMITRGKGQIINVGSTAGHDTYPSGNVYAATKFAVKALTKSMALDFYKHNIKVGQVSPGLVETEFSLVRYDGDEQQAKVYDDISALRPKDVARSIYFMASQPAHVNIQEILITPTQQVDSNFVLRTGKLTNK